MMPLESHGNSRQATRPPPSHGLYVNTLEHINISPIFCYIGTLRKPRWWWWYGHASEVFTFFLLPLSPMAMKFVLLGAHNVAQDIEEL